MKTKMIPFAAMSGLFLAACIPSVNPFYTDKDVVFENTLIGEWRTVGEDRQPERWNFEHSRNKHYDLTITDDEGKEGKFRATLFKLDDQLFLDLIPTDCEYATNQTDLVAFSMFPGHLLVQVAQLEPNLRMAFCDFDWLEDYLKENPKALPHNREADRIVLTASTRELQRFVLKHMKNDELFQEYGTLEKQPPAKADETATPPQN